jgi:predicted Zn-dependent peptidase
MAAMDSERFSDFLWWVRQLAIASLTLFFFVEGVFVLIRAYEADNPLIFIMLFFSSNLIILISAAGFLYPVLKVFRRLRGKDVLAVLLLLVPLLFPLAGQGATGAIDLDRTVHRYTLPNGLRLLVAERRISPTVSCYIRYKDGSVDEREEYSGTAHFLEHLLFKGTETIGTTDWNRERKLLAAIEELSGRLDDERKRGAAGDRKKIEDLEGRLRALEEESASLVTANEIDLLYTESGAVDLNASTGCDLTTYHVSLPANRLELWARIEADRMADAVFREFRKERQVIEEERRQTVESVPERMLTELFLGTAFLSHPYRRPIIGWPSRIPFLDIRYVRDFYRTYHVPDNAVVAVVGDVDPGRVLSVVTRYFGAVPARELPPGEMAGESAQAGERRAEYVGGANGKLLVGYHKPTLPSPDDTVFDLIDVILTGGRTSRLHRILVEEKEVASSIESTSAFPGVRYPNLFVFFASPRAPHGTAELEAALLAELERLRREPVTDREIEKAKNIYRAQLLREMSTNEGFASLLSYFEIIAGDFRYLSKQLEAMEKVTADDIRRVAAAYFVEKNRTVAVLKGKETP